MLAYTSGARMLDHLVPSVRAVRLFATCHIPDVLRGRLHEK